MEPTHHVLRQQPHQYMLLVLTVNQMLVACMLSRMAIHTTRTATVRTKVVAHMQARPHYDSRRLIFYSWHHRVRQIEQDITLKTPVTQYKIL